METFNQWLENYSDMHIKIKDEPVVTGGDTNAWNYRKLLQQYAGEWLPVETDHLFGDQFNTGSPSNLRVMLKNVSDIKNDVRPHAAKCGWCGRTYLFVADEQLGEPCSSCNAYPMRDEAVLDRIRPLVTVRGGEYITVYPALRQRKIKTPEGDVYRTFQPKSLPRQPRN
ncbi:MAG: hypothetical protein DWQ19_09970 [Crenarchaeota archaeon]|nr:MAG: hypothetical protein DWQ19_09970 [Thermoproteota archaeon]